ncbi:hypothetical protein [Bradyrhizobium sp. JYMT SZCCT0428]|uniref:hypothetical protein n=1 Tax=Bradyrhizobium sp. JYMT SZCCT0428 TaxID=2807673 RepID=UPI001BABDDB5|nr:hypothetical protein [Bradyrhizobium sp. JYMT SZCCT0428]MBR1150877.1 hypothetical protein [Bradyrhizobium sp. JYMT SZCCT0428]
MPVHASPPAFLDMALPSECKLGRVFGYSLAIDQSIGALGFAEATSGAFASLNFIGGDPRNCPEVILSLARNLPNTISW